MTEPKDKIKRLTLDYRHAFSDPEGQRVLADLALQCYENSLTYIDGNPNATAFNEGKRFVILHIRRVMGIDLEQL